MPQSSSEKPSEKTSEKSTNSMGWGSNIQTARLARAAESALKSGNYLEAMDYAQRATQAAPGDAQLWFLLGYTARLAGKTELSVDAFNHGLRVNPSSLEGESGLAQTYIRMGRRDEAQKILERVVAADPRRTSDLLLLGETLLQSGQYTQAISTLQSGEQRQPAARSELLLALAYERLKDFKQAQRYLEMAKKRSPNNPEVIRALAGYYRETENYPAAVAALKSIRNGGPEIMAEVGYTYQLWGKRDEAAKFYVQAADKAPRDLNLQLSAAEAELAIGDSDAANRFVVRASGLNADHYRLHVIRGEIARLEDRNQDAVAEYKSALAALPASPQEGPLYAIQLRVTLAQLYERLEDDSSAQSQIAAAQAQIAEIKPDDHNREEFFRLRASVELAAGEAEKALQDVHDAIALNPKDTNALQLNGDLLVRMNHLEDAVGTYKKVLAIDPDNELALTSLGSVSRQLGDDRAAEKYLLRLAAAHPHYYVPYLALGDMYTSRREFAKAESDYLKAHNLAPKNSLIVAGGINAGIEAHQFELSRQWLARATPEMQANPQFLREKERYLLWTKQYEQSADVGREAIKKLPMDRDVVVYLGYDLLDLERYDELLQLTSQYEGRMPKEADLPLLAGYVYKHNGDRDKALAAFTRAVERDPNSATAYVNRGFVLHDMRKGGEAASDFQAALRIEPKNGEAHIGLAYANLDLNRARPALENAKLAEKELGDLLALHLIRGTAYGDEGKLRSAAAEYRIALKSMPNDASLYLALANTLYGLHEYKEAIGELQASDKLAPGNGAVYAQIARCYAHLDDRTQAMHYIALAEKQGPSTVYLFTGDALAILGDWNAAMGRFEMALAAADSDRIGVRLAVADMMMKRGETSDARRQVVLALMEAASGRAAPPTGTQLIQAGDIFLGIHEYQLAQTYFQRALAAGAPEEDVRVGLANAYLASGDTPRAEAQLAAVSQNSDVDEPNYQYLLAQANVYRQRRQNVQALTAFGQAAEAAGEDQTAQVEMLRASADEGLRINEHLSFISDYSLSPIFEDTTVYALDAQLLGAPLSALPLPRSSIQSQWTEAYHLHFAGMPDAGGFFQVRNARGEISLPSANTIVDRDTWDYTVNFGVNPSLRMGNNVFNFNGGVQQTVRRDNADPYEMNQNLFRQFLYLSTSSFFNWVSVDGFAIREAGPFTESHQHSRDLSGLVDFRVGRPWANTGFVAGWGARDEQFGPITREFYYTSSYAGIDHRFSDRLHLRAIGEYLRSWRVEQQYYGIAQAFRPAGTVDFAPTRNWTVQASAAYSRNMGFHAYDAVQSGFTVSYAMPVRRTFQEGGHSIPLQYPIRFSAGMQQESFFNFNEGNNQQLRPFVEISIF
ncbi:MAG: tetratricopeptide repeat protein [Terriglobales bacterium]